MGNVRDDGDRSIDRLLGRPIADLGSDNPAPGHAFELEHDDESEGGDARIYADSLSAGMSLVAQLDEGLVHTIQLYAGGHHGHSQYRGPVPAGLGFDVARESVRARLGTPDASGEPSEVHPFGPMPAWDRYDLEAVSLHLEYQLDASGIRLISISRR